MQAPIFEMLPWNEKNTTYIFDIVLKWFLMSFF